MKEPNTLNKEAIGERVIEDISQIQHEPLGAGAATCQVCGSTFSEGDPVTAYVFRPAGAPMFQLGYVTCGDGDHDRPDKFTLGVRELVVGGRVGRCADVATQSTWPVLLAPQPRAVSAAATRSARILPEDTPTPVPPEPTTARGEAQRSAHPDDYPQHPLWGAWR